MRQNETNPKEEMAIFRYDLISPALKGTFEEKSHNEYFQKVSNEEHELPNGKKQFFSKSTIKKWYYLYKEFGFEGLKNVDRMDYGTAKKVPLSVLDTIGEIRKKKPRITKAGLYNELCELGEIRQIDVSLSTFYRFLRAHGIEYETTNTERKRFEAEHCNHIWQADTSQVMRIKQDGKSKIVYLVHIIDDASRMIVGQGLTYQDTAVFFQKILKSAMKKYGIPDILYVDNGGPYSNKQLHLICATLSIQLINAKPYSPQREREV